MKQTVLFSVFAVILAFLLPLLLSPAGGARAPAAETPAAEDPPAPSAERTETPVLDASISLTVHTDSGDVEMTMAEYLPLALAGEMPASFETEALRAQAVALRSYALYYRDHPKANHPTADVCVSPGCCAAFADEDTLRTRWGGNYDVYRAKLGAAAADTDGQYLVWESEPILAVFHASSLGCTEEGADLGTEKPYLVSVSTPETAAEVRNLNSTVEVTPEEFKRTVLLSVPDAAFAEEDPAAWLGEITLNAAGRVGSAVIGGQSVSGLTLRQLFGLRSTDFTLAWDGDGQKFVFRVSGYGHGLGMSQYGANLMAKDGASYTEILSHYYPGAELVMAVLER